MVKEPAPPYQEFSNYEYAQQHYAQQQQHQPQYKVAGNGQTLPSVGSPVLLFVWLNVDEHTIK